jgi:hypothetical protein
MVPRAEFWQTYPRMQNASEAGAETSISAHSTPKTSPVPSDSSVGRVVPASPPPAAAEPLEIGGPPGPEPTRYGDWEKKGRCIDF